MRPHWHKLCKKVYILHRKLFLFGLIIKKSGTAELFPASFCELFPSSEISAAGGAAALPACRKTPFSGKPCGAQKALRYNKARPVPETAGRITFYAPPAAAVSGLGSHRADGICGVRRSV